jgi:hypothetical protein
MHGSEAAAGSQDKMSKATEKNDEDEWEVEEIVACRVSRGNLQYQVRWKGCDPYKTWYPAHSFKGAPYKV